MKIIFFYIIVLKKLSIKKKISGVIFLFKSYQPVYVKIVGILIKLCFVFFQWIYICVMNVSN